VTGPVRFADVQTPGGYLCGEVASALQKEIRRGHERNALYWATELDLAGYGGYVWKRLRIIASEDVGLADTQAAVAVRALYENWLEQRKRKDDNPSFARVFLVHAVCVLARAPKSRMLDHVLMVMYEGERPHPDVPDYALDKHTARGRRMGRGKQHFLEVAAQLVGEEMADPYREEAHEVFLGEQTARPSEPA
jgi:replication-associated recombination protein RarA